MNQPDSMRTKVQQYLAFRRGLGYQLRIEGRLLEQFARYADRAGHHGPLTVELALRWARRPRGADQLYWARRLEIVRGFARHLAAVEPATQIPARQLLGPAHRRTTPYIYSSAEVAALMAAAQQLAPASGLWPHTYATLLGLLACAGLRISEALRLRCADVDCDRGVLTIWETKFGKSRIVPLHPTATRALAAYAQNRARLVTKARSDYFFVSDWGEGLPYSTVRTVFRKLCEGQRITGLDRRPRLHDVRHTFACRRVEQWYDAGVQLPHAVSALSVYLGHAKVSDTYWFLTATPELLARAAARFESFTAPAAEEVLP
jgi:integrase